MILIGKGSPDSTCPTWLISWVHEGPWYVLFYYNLEEPQRMSQKISGMRHIHSVVQTSPLFSKTFRKNYFIRNNNLVRAYPWFIS